jgi:heme A synthase
VNLVENPAMVQFVHRALAWALVALGLWLWHTLRVHGIRRQANLLLSALAVQFTLGILTILHLPSQPVVWGATHQAGAVAVLVATILVLHTVTREAPVLSPT